MNDDSFVVICIHLLFLYLAVFWLSYNKLDSLKDGCRIEAAGEVIPQSDGMDSKILIIKCRKGYWNNK